MRYAPYVPTAIRERWNTTPDCDVLRTYLDGNLFYGTIPEGQMAQRADGHATKVGRFWIVDVTRDENMGGFAELFTVQFNFFTPELSPKSMSSFLTSFAQLFHDDYDWTLYDTGVVGLDFIRVDMLPGWGVRPGDTDTGNEGFASMAFLIG